MDLDQTAPTGSRSTLFVKEASKYFSRRQKHTTFVICFLRVNNGEFSEYTVTFARLKELNNSVTNYK